MDDAKLDPVANSQDKTLAPTPAKCLSVTFAGGSLHKVGLQPRFATLTLPAEYDNYPLATRLLLQSRYAKYGEVYSWHVVRTDGKKARRLRAKNRKAGNNMVVRLNPGVSRKFTWSNIKICLDLTWLIFPRCVKVVARHSRALALPWLAYVASIFVRGLLPAAGILAAGKMTELVENAFQGDISPWPTTLRVAGTAIGLTIFNEKATEFSMAANKYLSDYIDRRIKRLFFESRLNLLVYGSQDKTYHAAVEEAGVFSGELRLRGGSPEPDPSPWTRLRIGGDILSTIIELGTKIALVLRTFTAASGSRSLSPSTLLLLVLSVGPSVIEAINLKLDDNGVSDTERELWQYEEELGQIMGFASRPSRQELMLFGFKDWLLEHYDRIITLLHWYQRRSDDTFESWMRFATDILSQVISNGFYVLLATGVIPSTFTLSTLQMHRETADGIYGTFLRLKFQARLAFQLPFLLTSTFMAADGPAPLGRHLNYEDVRGADSRGMCIEARNLSYTYPGATEPALRNINLTIEAGECLAVVGFNGGGKSTLVKTLLGINGHSGDLLINDNLYEDYDSATVHKRMSCLFQEFMRYPLSVRANVGLGDVSKIFDDDAIWEALNAGNATGDVKAIGGLEKVIISGGGGNAVSSWRVRGRVNFDDEEEDDDSSDSDDDDSDDEAENQAKTGDSDKTKDTEVSDDPKTIDSIVQEGKEGDAPGAPTASKDSQDDSQTTEVVKVGVNGDANAKNDGHDGDKAAEGVPGDAQEDAKNIVDDEKVKKRPVKKVKSKPKLPVEPPKAFLIGDRTWQHTGLSGGQWQRIALARTFMRAKTADLVVFDEPSSALDPKAEAALFDRIYALSHQDGQRVTTIFISHRFSTVRRADKIAFVDGGQIIEYGTHDELMARGGKYHELFVLQREGFADSDPATPAFVEPVEALS